MNQILTQETINIEYPQPGRSSISMAYAGKIKQKKLPKKHKVGTKTVNLCIATSDVQFRDILFNAQKNPAKEVEVNGYVWGPAPLRHTYGEAYREVFLLGCEEAAYDMLYTLEGPGYGITNAGLVLPFIYVFPEVRVDVFDEEELEIDSSHSWVLPVKTLAEQMKGVIRVPSNISTMQAGLAMLRLRDEFDSEEEKKYVNRLLNKYCWISPTEAERILDRWREANSYIAMLHRLGNYA